MDQRGLVFLPHVLAVETGTTVTFLNSDNEQHNVYFLFDETGETLDIGTWGPGVSVDHRFDAPGEVIVLCKLHLEMAAYVVVLDTPWFATCELDDSASSRPLRDRRRAAGRVHPDRVAQEAAPEGGSRPGHRRSRQPPPKSTW